MASTVLELPQCCTPLQLLQALREHAQALFQVTDEVGAGKLLAYIAAGDKIPHEWGHL